MLVQLLEVLDTAIKIGLGATIAGIITYHVTRLNIRSELQQQYWVRRLDALESASEKSERYFHRWRRLASHLGAIYRRQEGNVTEFNEGQMASIKSRDRDLIDAREELHLVIARLRLLGANDAADALGSIYGQIGKFRDPMMLGEVIPSHAELREVRRNIDGKVNEFHAAMSAHYRELEIKN